MGCVSQSEDVEWSPCVKPMNPLLKNDLAAKREHVIDYVTISCGHKAALEEGQQHPYMKLDAKQRVQIGASLFRKVEACRISAPWTEELELSSAADFWGAYDKLDAHYAMSKDLLRSGAIENTEKKIYFMSQSWSTPKEWGEYMGQQCSYEQAKAAEICCASKDIAARELGGPDKWERVEFWVDKCCIPQGDVMLMSWCVNLLEEFIVFSNGLVVLSPWTYFTRLWCVYEWVCFLLIHDPMDIEICADPFIRDSTIPLYVECIQSFKIEKCQCFHEPDRAILVAKVDYYYKSREAFETFLKFSTVALFARCVASRRSGKAASSLKPWSDLALKCGFRELAGKISAMAQLLPEWRTKAVRRSKNGATHDVQTTTQRMVDEWFKVELVPLVIKSRSDAATERGLAYISELKQATACFFR